MSSAPQIPGYDLTGPLGTGSTATVWRARRLADGLPVAVKVIVPAGGRVGEALAEAGLLARVRHQHVVHLYDVLPLPTQGGTGAGTGDGPAVALVTQLAAGGSLAQVLARRAMLSPGELVTVLQPVAGALADLHQQGVVHGDLSTGNLLFREDGMPLLADLGTARIAGEALLQGVGTGAGDGMVAPEVVEGFPATRESDVYQLGALARLCLVGEVPGPGFERETLAEVAPALPELLVDLVERCMAAQPEDRPDAEELAAALDAVAPPEPVEVAPDADVAHGLTQRLRQAAQEDEAARGGREAPGAHRPERVDGERTEEETAGRGLRLGRITVTRTHGRALTALAVGAVVLAMLVGVGWPVVRSWLGTQSPAAQAAGESAQESVEQVEGVQETGDVGDEGADRSPAEGRTEGGGAEPESGGAEPEDVIQTDDVSRAEGEEAGQTLQALVDARAQAWERGDEALLDDAVAPESPALAQEVRELARAREQGVSYPTVRFAVRDAVVVERDEGRMVLAAALDRDPLEAVGPQGWLLRAPARTDTVQVELVRVGERWLLWSWEPVEV